MCLVFSVWCLAQMITTQTPFAKHQIQNTKHLKYLRYHEYTKFHIPNSV
jgi:hypothetical protein